MDCQLALCLGGNLPISRVCYRSSSYTRLVVVALLRHPLDQAVSALDAGLLQDVVYCATRERARCHGRAGHARVHPHYDYDSQCHRHALRAESSLPILQLDRVGNAVAALALSATAIGTSSGLVRTRSCLEPVS